MHNHHQVASETEGPTRVRVGLSIRVLLFCPLLCVLACGLSAQDLAGIEIHGFATQGFLFSSNNNYLTMKTSDGSLQWTDGAVSLSDSLLSDNLRVGIQLHMNQLGQLGGPNIHVDWASGDYKINDYLGFRAGKVKTVMGLFNDSQDVDAIFLWALLPQSCYPADNVDFFLAHTGGDAYGELPLGKRAGKLRYNVHVGEVSLDLDGGYLKQFADLGLLFNSAPAGKGYGGDLRWETPLNGLLIGSSEAVEGLDGTAPFGALHVAPFQINADYAQFTKGRFYFAGEYDRAPFNAILTLGQTVTSLPFDERSWYVMGSYRLRKNLSLGSYYSHFLNKVSDTTQPAGYSKDSVISGRYDFNPYFYGKIEGHFLQGTALGYYPSTNPNGLKPNSNMLAAKVGFTF